LPRKANTSNADGPLQISKETLFYGNDGLYAKYNQEGNVVLHAAIEKILLKQLFFVTKR